MTWPLKRHFPKILVTLFLLLPVFAYAETTYIQEAVWGLVVSLFGSIVGWMAVLLDSALRDFVINFGSTYSTGVGNTIDILWVNVRDIFNITFIFGLLYIGFKMILNSEDSNTRRWLINLILAALLVNFSLFFTKIVIDISNMMATEIAMSGLTLVGGYPSIGTTFMDNVGLQSAIGNKDGLSGVISDGAWSYIFGTMILFIVAAFVFAAGAFLLFIRFAALLLYMVFSPFMFIGWVLPQMASYTGKYWQGFLGRAFFAPLYILLVYLSMQIISSYYAFKTPNGIGAELGTAMSGGTGNDTASLVEGSFAPFVLASIFMIASVVIANKLGADGASASLSLGKNLAGRARRGTQRFAGAATAGMAARGGRMTAGRVGNALANSRTMRNFAASDKWFVGKAAMKAAQTASKATYDVRNVGGIGKAMGVGSGQTGGYAGNVEKKAKANEAFLKSIETQVDWNDPKTKAKISTRTDEITKTKTNQASAYAASANNVKEDTNKTSSVLNTEMETLQQKIEQMEKDSKLAEKNGTKTKDELAEAKLTIEAEKLKLEAKNTVSAKMADKEKVAGEISELEKKANDPYLSGQAKAQYQTAIRQKNQNIEKLDKEINEIADSLQKKSTKLQEEAKKASEFAKAEVEFENEIAYMKDLEAKNKRLSGLIAKAASAVVGTKAGAAGAGLAGIGTLATGGAIAGGGLIAAGALGSYIDGNNATLANLQKKYGADGMKGAENKKQKKAAEDIVAVLKEQGGLDNSTQSAPQNEPDESKDA